LFHRQDIQFESDAFNKAWDVRADDAQYAYGVVNPRFMEILMDPDFPRAPYCINGPDVMTWRGAALTTGEVLPRLAALAAIAESIPRHVWDDYGRR
jgi:hypothetical protein